MSVAFRRIKILPILIIGSIAGSVFAAIFDLENHLLLNAVPGLLGTSNIFIYLLSHLVGVAICLILFPIVLKKIN